jgi:hypothetical protein
MRMFLISLALAAVLTLPQAGAAFGFAVPAVQWLGIPATGLAYMLVFFHEIGHCLSFWVFGYPSIPTFDFAHGGGYTYAYARSSLVLGFVWACAALCGWHLWRERAYARLSGLMLGTALHGVLILTGKDQVVTAFAGHAAEVLVAAFCLLRAFLGTTDPARGQAERWLNMVFGCFVLVYDTVFTAALMLDGTYRDDYAAQKGGHLEGDLDQIAQALHVSFGATAFFLMAFTLGVFAVAIYAGLRQAPRGKR